MTASQVVLPRVVRSVGEPKADDLRAEPACDLDALEAVVECAAPNGRVGIGEASEPIGVVSEEVRVDCADPDAIRRDIANGFERKIMEAFR